MIRLLHASDSHLGAHLPARPRRDGPRRGDDLIAGFERALSVALREPVDLIIHTGDLFHSPAPSSSAIMAAARPLLEVATAGIPVVLMAGRYDRRLAGLPLLLAHPDIHWMHRPGTLHLNCRGVRVSITAIPPADGDEAAELPHAVYDAGGNEPSADLRILAVHDLFDGAVRGPLGRRYPRSDETIPLERLPPGFDYIAAGGVHRHQTLAAPAGPPVVYAGSTERVDFRERCEPKGCVLADWTDGRPCVRFVEHPVRPMAIVPLDVTGLRRGRILDAALEAVGGLPMDTFAELRLTGSATRGTLTSLDLAGRGREIRPDVLLHVAFQSVEIRPRSPRPARTRAAASAFACLHAPPEATIHIPAEAVNKLPRRPGTYCLYDDTGRLLYVGKARNLRARVGCHVRAPADDGYFAGWTRRIARIEARPALSELEALLVEAELVRRRRPPFNQQMRHWSRYCYLAPGADGQTLTIHRRRPRVEPAFGPYRSVGRARAILEALGPHTAGASGYALLAGTDDGIVGESETLRAAFEHGVLLREAETLIGRLLVLPGDGETRRAVRVTERGLRFEACTAPPAETEGLMVSPAADEITTGRLRRSVVDSLLLIVRHLRATQSPPP